MPKPEVQEVWRCKNASHPPYESPLGIRLKGARCGKCDSQGKNGKMKLTQVRSVNGRMVEA